MKVAKCIPGEGRGMNSFNTKRWAAKDAKSDPVQKEYRSAYNRRQRRAGKMISDNAKCQYCGDHVEKGEDFCSDTCETNYDIGVDDMVTQLSR